MDRNGYNDSILQDDMGSCFLCFRSDEKLDRHEIFGGAFREKAKRDGLWVCLCHSRCHLYGVHQNAETARELRRQAQEKAMSVYGWTTKEFISRYGKNYKEEA